MIYSYKVQLYLLQISIYWFAVHLMKMWTADTTVSIFLIWFIAWWHEIAWSNKLQAVYLLFYLKTETEIATFWNYTSIIIRMELQIRGIHFTTLLESRSCFQHCVLWLNHSSSPSTVWSPMHLHRECNTSNSYPKNFSPLSCGTTVAYVCDSSVLFLPRNGYSPNKALPWLSTEQIPDHLDHFHPTPPSESSAWLQ